MGKAGCHGVLSRGWRWERQDAMVYCPEAGGGKGRMSWCTVQRLEVGKAGCHGVLSRGWRCKAGCHGVLSIAKSARLEIGLIIF